MSVNVSTPIAGLEKAWREKDWTLGIEIEEQILEYVTEVGIAVEGANESLRSLRKITGKAEAAEKEIRQIAIAAAQESLRWFIGEGDGNLLWGERPSELCIFFAVESCEPSISLKIVDLLREANDLELHQLAVALRGERIRRKSTRAIREMWADR